VVLSNAMRISELARRADVTIPTVKFYLRQGLLPEGLATAATRAEYSEAHLNRVRLIRALVDVAGLSLSEVRALLTTLDEHNAGDLPAASGRPAGRPKKGPKVNPGKVLGSVHAALPPKPPEHQRGTARATAAVSALGWQVEAGSVPLQQLEAALATLDALGLTPSVATLLTYGEAAEKVASADVASLPEGPAAATVRHLVLGTAIYEPVLVALHRLAQQNAFTNH